MRIGIEVELVFPCVVNGQCRETHYFYRVPHEGESIVLPNENRAWIADRVIHAGDPIKGQPAATIFVK